MRPARARLADEGNDVLGNVDRVVSPVYRYEGL